MSVGGESVGHPFGRIIISSAMCGVDCDNRRLRQKPEESSCVAAKKNQLSSRLLKNLGFRLPSISGCRRVRGRKLFRLCLLA